MVLVISNVIKRKQPIDKYSSNNITTYDMQVISMPLYKHLFLHIQ